MSSISAKALFHFTSSKETLLKIIETGFRPSYCKEFGENITGNRLQELYIPMTCFCDLPLSNTKNHMTGTTWLNNNDICTTLG